MAAVPPHTHEPVLIDIAFPFVLCPFCGLGTARSLVYKVEPLEVWSARYRASLQDSPDTMTIPACSPRRPTRSIHPWILSHPPPKKALLIGINYTHALPHSAYPTLRLPQQDTKAFKALLEEEYGYLPENITMMLDEAGIDPDLWPTRENLLREIHKFVHGAQYGNNFVLYYSGHSGQIASQRPEEEDGFDEYIVPVDHDEILSRLGASYPPTEEQVKKAIVIDDDLREILVNPLPIGARLTAFLDSCHSATLLDLDHYSCNRIYHPWVVPKGRGYKTWESVREDERRMSQVIPKKRKRSGSMVDSTPPHRSRENSQCSVRAHQRRRVGESETEITHTVVDISDAACSMQSRRASACTRIGSGLAPRVEQSEDDGQPLDSLDKDGSGDGGVFGPRCLSPPPAGPCDSGGFCELEDGPPECATVISFSSCKDNQRTWESRGGTFTERLIRLLKEDPHPTIGKLLESLMYQMLDQARKTHKWSKRRKDSYDRKKALHAECACGDACEQCARDQQFLDLLEFTDIPIPQLGAQRRLDLTEVFDM